MEMSSLWTNRVCNTSNFFRGMLIFGNFTAKLGVIGLGRDLHVQDRADCPWLLVTIFRQLFKPVRIRFTSVDCALNACSDFVQMSVTVRGKPVIKLKNGGLLHEIFSPAAQQSAHLQFPADDRAVTREKMKVPYVDCDRGSDVYNSAYGWKVLCTRR